MEVSLHKENGRAVLLVAPGLIGVEELDRRNLF